MEKTKKEKSRNFNLLMYPDCEEHKNAMELIQQIGYKYACILHDKDVDVETGEIKKAHWHVVLSLGNSASGRYASGIAKELGITENYVQICKNKKGSLRYLLHIDDNEKYQYNIDEVKGCLKAELVKTMADEESECVKVSILIEYIEKSTKKISVMEFSKFCVKTGYWDVFRRSSSIFLKMIDDHNQQIAFQEAREDWENQQF